MADYWLGDDNRVRTIIRDMLRDELTLDVVREADGITAQLKLKDEDIGNLFYITYKFIADLMFSSHDERITMLEESESDETE